MVDPDSRISVSVGEDGVQTVEDFEDYFQGLEGNYSRSGRIKEAMAFYKAIHETVNDLEHVDGPDELGQQEFKFYVRQAIYDRDRKEAAGEV